MGISFLCDRFLVMLKIIRVLGLVILLRWWLLGLCSGLCLCEMGIDIGGGFFCCYFCVVLKRVSMLFEDLVIVSEMMG